ncbi:hypothetical protein PAECIP111892_05239 [Paenibacillus auburnensis]|uniref:Nuclease SbcCD subunit C n=1 Tax=Paenibacillus auburnensis TaxID=2905649 RepID=A0ABN8H6Z7_9BACL|nr:hypothetical protein [Paenibacillus auburnensis]CAH1222931.1 hypothetical protein PAECIP111892_05239 [Paenibacillus auburnensis]
MKIQKIRLENFRQYLGEQTIEFSTDETKNLTLCLAKNNGGKTTLAQSIIWCLYGVTNLNEPKEILNKSIKLSMREGSSIKVAVTLEIIHRSELYIIRREKNYQKTNTRLIEDDSELTILTYDNNNVLIDVSGKDINDILPRSLSRFFIFDGERMLHLGTNNAIQKEELEKDIRTILGLDVLEEAISHLGGKNNTGGVLLCLNKKFDNSNDSEMENTNNEINEINAEIDQLDEQIEESTSLQSQKELDKIKLSEFLEQNKHIKEKQLDRNRLELELNGLIDRKEKEKKQLLRKFSGNLPYLLLQKLFDKSISFVADSSELEEAAPDVTSLTINYILDKKECICGTTFLEKDSIYNKLESNKKYYPPESIGTTTKRYLDVVRGIARTNEDTKSEIQQMYGDYLEVDSDIHDIKVKLDAISRDIQESSEEKVKEAEEQYQAIKQELKELNDRLTELNTAKKFQLQSQLELQEKLEELSNRSEQNKKIIRYREVAKEVLNHLKQSYDKEKDKVRDELQKEVQKVYATINRGNGKIKINEKFDFELYTESHGQLVKDNSKGQGLSTVSAFSFVCGITKLVREKKMNEEINYGNEPYPLIIDAPYSVMDTDYIEKVSQVLPAYAEQLIILVKDDNFNTAKSIFEDMGVIGKEYHIELERNSDGTENQFVTKIQEKEIDRLKVGVE